MVAQSSLLVLLHNKKRNLNTNLKLIISHQLFYTFHAAVLIQLNQFLNISYFYPQIWLILALNLFHPFISTTFDLLLLTHTSSILSA